MAPSTHCCDVIMMRACSQVYVLAGLLARFEFSQVQPGSKVDCIFSTSLPMKQGLQVTVQERE
jgi:hypothetical protein